MRAVPGKRPCAAPSGRQVSLGLTFPRRRGTVRLRPFPTTSPLDSSIRVPHGRHLGEGPPLDPGTATRDAGSQTPQPLF